MKKNMKLKVQTNFRPSSTRISQLIAASVLSGSVALVSAVVPQAVFAQEANQNAAGLNFVNADIESVVKAIGHYTGTTFLIDPRVKGQITLVSEKPLTKEQAFKLLTSNLRLQGFAVVTSDGFSKVVPESDAKLQGGPTQVKGVKGDQIITQVFRVNYESANNLVTALRPLISPNNVINVSPGNNSIVITDYADNIRRMAEVIALLDVPGNPELEIVPIKHAIAGDIATMATRLTESNQAGGDAGRTVIMADSRTNSVLIKAPSVARGNLVKAIVNKLDQETDLPGNVHVVYLKNAEATKLAQSLRSILSGDTSSSGAISGNSSSSLSNSNLNNTAGGVGGQTQGNNSALTSSGSNFSLPVSSSGNAQASGGAGGFIQADSATNTLIITASDAVYRNLRGVIDRLDSRRAQVYIEALIVEVSATASNDLGIQWMGATGDSKSPYRLGAVTSYPSDTGLLGVAAAGSDTAKQAAALSGHGLTVGLFKQVAGRLTIGALAHALASDSTSNILSVPNIVTLDNEEAKFVVGQNVPFITGQYSSLSAGTANANPFQTIERKDVGIKLVVKPQISEGGTVKLGIFQEVSSVDSTNNAAGIITNVSSFSTNVLAEDGQIIALGGLISDDKNAGVEKVSFLGDIPIIGNLFKYKSQKRVKKNLMVFLRPVVIRDAEQSNSVSLDRYDYLRTQYLQGSNNGEDLMKLEKGKLMLPNLGSAAGGDKSKTENKEGK
jgi:general secretion pathway protein D